MIVPLTWNNNRGPSSSSKVHSLKFSQFLFLRHPVCHKKCENLHHAKFPTLWYSGISRIIERGIQVQADYGNSTHCYIMAGEEVFMSMQRLRSRRPPAQSTENFQNLGPLRSLLLAFQPPYSEHWSSGRRGCRICSTAPVGLIASFCSQFVKLTTTSQWQCQQILPHCISNWMYLQTNLKLNSIAALLP